MRGRNAPTGDRVTLGLLHYLCPGGTRKTIRDANGANDGGVRAGETKGTNYRAPTKKMPESCHPSVRTFTYKLIRSGFPVL
jgi:hypothetical protein